MKKYSLFIISSFLVSFSFAQQKFWKLENELSVKKLSTPQEIIPQVYHTFSLPFDQYKTFLKTAPLEVTTNIKNGLEITLPYPDNSFKKFRIVETKIMEDGLAKQFPNIKTYSGQGVDDPAAKIRIDYTEQGFHAFVLSPSGNLFIDPYQKANNNLYISYFSKDYKNPLKENHFCSLADQPKLSAPELFAQRPLTGTCNGTQLKTYRAAISCTGEYAIAVCPVGNVTVANTMSAIMTTMNRVNGVYESELSIRLIIIAGNASIVYLNPATDPYSGNTMGSVLINEAQSNITSVIGSANFDIGHTFSTGGGGIANLRVVCGSIKASGVTGTMNPTGDAYDIDYVAHEMGHQFGANHPFESENSFCVSPGRVAQAAYEPGGGTTIMSYSGLCGSDNIQPNSNPYFHTKNFDEIIAYITTGNGNTCPVVTATGNALPVITMPVSGLKIPKSTPFTLTGSATDADGDALTYSWEEWDISNLSNGSAWNSGATSTVTPLFKVRNPKLTGSRTFPDIAVILAGYPANPSATMNGLKGETLPQIARDIKFRLVVRDNKTNGGGVVTGGDGCSSTPEFKVVVTDDGPFTVTAPNTAVTWLGGSTQTVSWNVANTNSPSGINAQNVDILMSTDGGTTYPTTILTNVLNNGTKAITVPNIPTNTNVRFMVKASGNIFFDISDVNFTITFNSVLPVSLTQFSANPVDNSILLEWTTVTEENNNGFDILRSEGNSNNFTKIGFVPAATPNSNNVSTYNFTDNNVTEGVDYFYRLRQIDIDNNFLFSEIKKARINGNTKFAVILQPQPFHNNGELLINGIEKKNFNIIITDVAGRIISKKEIPNTELSRKIPVELKGQASGVYFIKVFQNNIEHTLRAVKL